MEKEKPDVLVGLFHAGVDYSYGGVTADTKYNENASQLVAQRVPGFDLIFVGHDHSGWDGMGWDPATKKKVEVKDPDGKTVYIYGALNAARRVPVVNLTLDWNADKKAWDKRVRGGLVDIGQYKSDPGFEAQFQAGFDEIKSWVDRPVGKMDAVISSRDSIFGDSAFVDLIHRIQLDISKDPAIGLKPADISFAAPLSMDAKIPTSKDGTLYVRDMFNLYVYENFLYTMSLTGKQVDDFLEFSYANWFATMPNDGDHLIAFQKDKEGKLVFDARYNTAQTVTRYYNYDSAAGINYFVDVTKPVGDKVTITSMSDGRIFNPSETYTVAINSYRGSGAAAIGKGSGLDKETIRTNEAGQRRDHQGPPLLPPEVVRSPDRIGDCGAHRQLVYRAPGLGGQGYGQRLSLAVSLEVDARGFIRSRQGSEELRQGESGRPRKARAATFSPALIPSNTDLPGPLSPIRNPPSIRGSLDFYLI